jgi:enoyl-CoA hydratase/carnithine racemase
MIEFKTAGRVGHLTIRRADARNAFTGEMVRQFADALRQAHEAADLLVIRGEGSDFTIGRDRKEPKPTGGPFDAFRMLSETNGLLANFPGIAIVAVQGVAHGFGVGAIMRSDIAIAADDAHFGFDEVALGFPPMFVMQEMLQHVPPKRALDVLLSGRDFDAKEALEIGILSRVISAAKLDAEVDALVVELSKRDSAVLKSCKRYLREVTQMQSEARSAFALVEQTRFALSKV